MDENQDMEEIENEKEILEKRKKENEIFTKRKEACPFKTNNLDALELKEEEPFYRTPLVNIIESEDLYYIVVELPGLDKKQVKISLQEGILEINGEQELEDKEKKEEKKDKEKKEEKKDKEKKEKKDEKKDKEKKKEKHKKIKGNYLRREIRSNNFYICFHVPDDIFTEEIDASFRNGILVLRVPKKSAVISGKKVIEIK